MGIASFVAWEWINIALEYSAGAWLRMPRFFLAAVCVNLSTHPILMLLLASHGFSWPFVLICECTIVIVEWGLLICFYGRAHWRRLGLASLVMNSASFLTGLAL